MINKKALDRQSEVRVCYLTSGVGRELEVKSTYLINVQALGSVLATTNKMREKVELVTFYV